MHTDTDLFPAGSFDNIFFCGCRMPIRHYNLLFIIYIFNDLSKFCDGKAYILSYYVDASMISIKHIVHTDTDLFPARSFDNICFCG